MTHPNPFVAPATPAPLLILGAGGFAREVAWLAEQIHGDALEIEFVVDKAEYLSGPVVGRTARLLGNVNASETSSFVVAIGEPAARRRIAAECEARGLRPATLIHPRVEASRHVRVGTGSVICAGSIITTNVSIGAHVHINLGCTVGHDVTIGSHTTISPGVHVSGHVVIGDGVFIGTGANIIPGRTGGPLTIGEGAVIAAGACVTRPVEAGSMVAGVPAVRKK